MNWTSKLLAVALAAVALFSLDFHARSSAATELKLGVEAFKQSAYAEAILHLKKAVSLDPENLDARMYLAKAYVKQYVPGIHTPDNSHLAEQAIDQYQHVLDSTNRMARIDSAKGIAELYLHENKFEDSKKFYQMESDLDPLDPEPYFAIGGIDFDECTRRDTEEGAKLGLKPGEHPNPKNPDQKKACDELRAKNTPSIKEGIDSLNKAMELRPDDQGAMFYISLMYLEKAAVECDDLTAREEDQKTAGAWVNKIEFGVPVKARKSPFRDPDRQLGAACGGTGSGEFRGTGEHYDVAEAYEVYSAIIPIINTNPETHTWFIRIDTLPMGRGSLPPADPSERAREEKEEAPERKLADIALDDYSKVNAKRWRLQRNFTLPKPYKLVTPDEIKTIFPRHFRGGSFGELWIELSAVGFNADRTMAVVYMAHHCTSTCCCADGKSFLLQKHNGKWEVLSGVECWIS